MAINASDRIAVLECVRHAESDAVARAERSGNWGVVEMCRRRLDRATERLAAAMALTHN